MVRDRYRQSFLVAFLLRLQSARMYGWKSFMHCHGSGSKILCISNGEGRRRAIGSRYVTIVELVVLSELVEPLRLSIHRVLLRPLAAPFNACPRTWAGGFLNPLSTMVWRPMRLEELIWWSFASVSAFRASRE